MSTLGCHLTHPKYRPDIDGLRAIAILSVVAFHAFPELIQGGFVGVDVFFVISGYLISTIIFDNCAHRSFSFYEFYSRRVKRIFPALIFVMAVCFAFGWFVLFANEFKQLGKHMAGGAAFVANLVLYNEVGYFDNAADTKPLLHLWSLGIEEQFYIVFPPLVWLAFKYRYSALRLMLTISAVSFFLDIALIKIAPEFVFYMPHARFWELMCGGILAWFKCSNSYFYFGQYLKNNYLDRIPPPILMDGKLLANIASFIGLILLALSFSFIGKAEFPGYLALLPVMAAILVIAAGPIAWINRNLLANRYLVGIGLISYPLYLWHWPLLSFARIIDGQSPAPALRFFLVALSLLFAWLTYRFLEIPVRTHWKSMASLRFFVLMMLVVGGVGLLTYRGGGFESIKFKTSAEQQLQYLKEPPNFRNSDGSCQRLLGFMNIEDSIICLANSKSPEVLILGDSHAIALTGSAYLSQVNINFVMMAAHGCLPLVNLNLFDGHKKVEKCNRLARYALDFLEHENSIKEIVIATRGPLYYSGNGWGVEGKNQLHLVSKNSSDVTPAELFYSGYRELVSRLKQSGKNIVLVVDPPELGMDPSRCASSRLNYFNNKPLSTCTQERKQVLERQAMDRDIINRLGKEYDVSVYDPIDFFCDDRNCHAIMDSKILYWDDDHISILASSLILSDMLKKGLIH